MSVEGDGPGVGLDVGAELSFHIGALAGEMRQERERRRRRAAALRAERSIPVDARLTKAGVMPASGTLVLELGRPELDLDWLMRSFVVGGVTPTTVAAGAAYFYVQSSYPTDTMLSSVADWAPSLPAVAFYSNRQIPVGPSQRLWVVITGGTPAQTYLAKVTLEQYEQHAAADVFDL